MNISIDLTAPLVLATIVMAILKGVGLLTWSWWVVFLPVLIPIGVFFSLFILWVLFILTLYIND